MHSDWQHMPFLAELTEKPWRYSFFQLCRWMDAQSAPHPPLGTATLPRHESLRLGQKPSTAFATREIAEAFHEGGRVHVQLLGLGLWGPGGPLPLHLTEEAHERTLVLRDTTLTDFLNIFHHRWMAHFYRTWSMAQAAAGLDRAEEERFSFYTSCLAGQHLGGSHALPTHARLSAVSHLARRSRNPMGLVATLEHYFGVTVQLEEYCFDWLKLEPEAHCRLGQSRQPSDVATRRAHGEPNHEAHGVATRRAHGEAHREPNREPNREPDREAHHSDLTPTPATWPTSDIGNAAARRLAKPVGQSCCLGQDAVLGAYVPDRQCRFALHVGPLRLESYCKFLPGQPHARALLHWVREFVGLEFAFRVHLLLLPKAVPPCTLGGGTRLGRTTWLGRGDGHTDARAVGQSRGRGDGCSDGRAGPFVHGAVFSPEGR